MSFFTSEKAKQKEEPRHTYMIVRPYKAGERSELDAICALDNESIKIAGYIIGVGEDVINSFLYGKMHVPFHVRLNRRTDFLKLKEGDDVIYFKDVCTTISNANFSYDIISEVNVKQYFKIDRENETNR